MKKIVFFIVLVLCNIVNNAQPCTKVKELNRKRHRIEGSTYGHPYTMFDRHNGKTFTETIDSIRSRIKNEKLNDGPVYTAYKELYERAIKSMPANVENQTDNGLISSKTAEGNTEEGARVRALWAKENAFTF